MGIEEKPRVVPRKLPKRRDDILPGRLVAKNLLEYQAELEKETAQALKDTKPELTSLPPVAVAPPIIAPLTDTKNQGKLTEPPKSAQKESKESINIPIDSSLKLLEIGITRKQAEILSYLRKLADPTGVTAPVGYPRIAKELNRQPRSTQRMLSELAKKNVIEKVKTINSTEKGTVWKLKPWD